VLFFQIGLSEIFSNDANFSGITANKIDALKVAQVIQKAFLEVDEKGTVASAATGGMANYFQT
jgi:serine protease inhibitor